MHAVHAVQVKRACRVAAASVHRPNPCHASAGCFTLAIAISIRAFAVRAAAACSQKRVLLQQPSLLLLALLCVVCVIALLPLAAV